MTEDLSGDAWVAREYVKGRYQHEIATDIGVTTGSVCFRISRFCETLGYPVVHTHHGPARVVITRKALAQYRGEITPPTKFDLKYRQAYAAARYEHAWLLRAEGLTLRQIGKRLGVSHNQARVMIFQFSYRVKRATRKTRWRLQHGTRQF